MNKIEKKTMGELLGNYHLVVPEIQREYVWGNNPNSVLEQFLASLSNRLKSNEVSNENVGFLYSYQSTSYSGEHLLIDGQQRFTTLVLLLYYLSVKEGNIEDFQHLIRLSEPSLVFSYKVRATTDDFLRHLFESGLTDSKLIKASKGFVSDFNIDPTVNAILGAFDIFNKKNWELTTQKILDKVSFWYFDISATRQGEELYITMNSRGERLTDTEQIKPRLFSKLNSSDKQKFGKKWDEWEEFFYNLKDKDMSINVVDVAMSNLLKLYLELKYYEPHQRLNAVNDVDKIDLEDLSNNLVEEIKELNDYDNGYYRKEVKRLLGTGNDEPKDAYFFVLKSLLTEVHIHGIEDHNLERAYKTFVNLIRRGLQDQTALLHFLHGYVQSDSKAKENGKKGVSLYEYILNTQDNDDTKKLFVFNNDSQEFDKIKICNDHIDDHSVEEAIWNAESKDFWRGDIRPLLAIATTEGSFSIEQFIKEEKRFELLFLSGDDGWPTDTLRRALLTAGFDNYPTKGNRSFGWEHTTWVQILDKDNDEKLKAFIDGIEPDSSKQEAEDYLFSKIKSYPSDSDWAEFVEEPEYLEYLDTKHLSWDDRYGFQLVKRSWAQPISVKNMYLYLFLTRNKDFCELIKGPDWEFNVWKNWDSCVYIKNTSKNIVFNVRYLRKYEDVKEDCWSVDLFKWDEDPEVTKNGLNDIANFYGFVYNDENGRYNKHLTFDAALVMDLLSDIIKLF